MRTFLMFIGAALTVPLLILNWVAAAVGGVWLAINHEWRLIAIGVALMLLGRFLLAVFMGAAVLIAAPGAKLMDKSRILAWAFFLAAGLFNFVVLTCWSVWIFDYFVNHPHGNVWPYILWSYAAATMAWTHMTMDESKSDPRSQSISWLSGAQFGSLAIMASVLVGNGYQSEFGMTIFFVPVALLGIGMGAFMQGQRR